MSDQIFEAWILLKRCPDIEGWISHCLELDVISQGDNPKEAYDMCVEAAQMVMRWDLQDGKDPLERDRAPDGDYKDLDSLNKNGEQMEVGKALDDSKHSIIAVRVRFDLAKLRQGGEDCSLPPPEPAMRALAKNATSCPGE